MFSNHLKIAWRSLKKQPFFTFLNTFGLAVGMAGGLILCLYILDELGNNAMFPDADRIHRINTDLKFGGKEQKLAEVSAPMAEAIMEDLPEVELTTRFRNHGGVFIRPQESRENVREASVAFADSTVFKMLGIPLLYGDARTALTAPNTLVMTRSAAEKHFPMDRALGRTMVLDDDQHYRVTGVIEDLPKNSFLRDRGLLLAMSGYPDAQAGEWGSHNYYTLIKVLPGTDLQGVARKLQGMVGRYVIPFIQKYFPGITEQQFQASGNYLNYSTLPLRDIHLYSNRHPEFSAVSSIKNVYILGAIALILLVLASVNFMNLSTAHSLRRAKEIGIRKTLGSHRSGLIRQFLTESGLLTLGSLVLALGLAQMALPFFNRLSGRELSIPHSDPLFWIILLLATGALGLISGSYPALFMSRFVAAKVLKGQGDRAIGGGRVRNVLVILQFSISVFLIMGSLTVHQQLQYIQEKDLGYGKEQVLIIPGIDALDGKALAFKEAVSKLSQVRSASLSSYLPTPSARSSGPLLPEGNQNQENTLDLQKWSVDGDYIPTLGLQLLSGRNFGEGRGSLDSTGIILNEKAVAILGKDPQSVLGARLVDNFDNHSEWQVIGVVKDFHFESLRDEVGALGLLLTRERPSNLAIKLESAEASRTIPQIAALWERMAPAQPFEHYFMDDSFNNSYQAEQRLGEIFVLFTLLSIVIACLGLLGLAAFNAQKRVKEIGIRKVMGAKVGQIVYRLSMDFLKLVGLAILIALPLGGFAMERWLQDFSYRIAIPWWVFALSAVLALGVALLTVGYQSIRAAALSPVKSLRTD